MFTLLLVMIYLTAINLGLPDSVLGASWPILSEMLGVNRGSQGIISLIVSCFTIFTSFFSGKIIKKFGNGKVIVFSIGLTCVSLAAIGFVNSFFWLVFFSVPLGLGGGAVDTSMNDYVARNCTTRQLSWLHCFWGVGALVGPLIMSLIINGGGWRWGYYSIAIFQLVSMAVLAIFLPLWDKFDKDKSANIAQEQQQATRPTELATQDSENNSLCNEQVTSNVVPVTSGDQCNASADELLSNGVTHGIGGDALSDADSVAQPNVVVTNAKTKRPLACGEVWLSMLCFFLYSGAEALTGSWAATYLYEIRSFTADIAASAVSVYFLGITLGRFLLGFIADKVGDKKLIYGGIIVIMVAGALMFLPVNWSPYYFATLFLVGFGCAPVFPCMVHLTPTRFDKQFSAQIIGYQIGAAGLGVALVPPVLGFVGDALSYAVYPMFLCILTVGILLFQMLLNVKLRNSLNLR